jgi:hypothetical protein
MNDIRNIIDTLEDIYAEPEVGDVVEIALGDTLIETTISDITEDGVVIHIDEQAIRIMIDAKKQLDEHVSMRLGSDSDASAAGSYKMGEDTTLEADYHGRNVPLGKPMQGDVKKSKVYVRKPNGKVVKVNFGDKNMRIKKSIPARRKSFRARHHCESPGPRWKARYWSCRAW